ncbi:uncharacterized protein LOC130625684 [Hydractinia symbiolongicarpus]|uniref:uncharacterized protein LOC130625684 n=1 Tax=Hydractinia symbiolongicarpus TaxID=13093 RepID=UPI00254E40BC|nr:uncharacterized protein LOC130625684 [Hydractinia symbiolongicarpus]
MSSVARDAFVNVVNNLSKISSSRSVIRKLMMKCVGERDMGIQEVMHQILSLKLYRSSFNVITISLENSRKCSITNDEIITEKSCLEVYGDRGSYSTAVQQLNLIDFFSKYDVKKDKLQLRKEPVIVRTIPNYSPNPQGVNYDKYCKFQLLNTELGAMCHQMRGCMRKIHLQLMFLNGNSF